MMRVAADATGKDRAAREIVEDTAFDQDRSRSKAEPAGIRLRIVADAQRNLSEVREHRMIEHDALRRGYLHRGRHLRPVITARFEFPATPYARAYRVARTT